MQGGCLARLCFSAVVRPIVAALAIYAIIYIAGGAIASRSCIIAHAIAAPEEVWKRVADLDRDGHLETVQAYFIPIAADSPGAAQSGIGHIKIFSYVGEMIYHGTIGSADEGFYYLGFDRGLIKDINGDGFPELVTTWKINSAGELDLAVHQMHEGALTFSFLGLLGGGKRAEIGLAFLDYTRLSREYLSYFSPLSKSARLDVTPGSLLPIGGPSLSRIISVDKVEGGYSLHIDCSGSLDCYLFTDEMGRIIDVMVMLPAGDLGAVGYSQPVRYAALSPERPTVRLTGDFVEWLNMPSAGLKLGKSTLSELLAGNDTGQVFVDIADSHFEVSIFADGGALDAAFKLRRPERDLRLISSPSLLPAEAPEEPEDEQDAEPDETEPVGEAHILIWRDADDEEETSEESNTDAEARQDDDDVVYAEDTGLPEREVPDEITMAVLLDALAGESAKLPVADDAYNNPLIPVPVIDIDAVAIAAEDSEPHADAGDSGNIVVIPALPNIEPGVQVVITWIVSKSIVPGETVDFENEEKTFEWLSDGTVIGVRVEIAE
ncbi:hypothetical protein J7K50_06240 [bacterium]|nr:hypothetical protein [bacterium]